MSREKTKLCIYVDPEIKRKLMYLRADTEKDMSDIAELALRMFFEIIESGDVTEETKKRLRAELAAAPQTA